MGMTLVSGQAARSTSRAPSRSGLGSPSDAPAARVVPDLYLGTIATATHLDRHPSRHQVGVDVQPVLDPVLLGE